MCPSGWPRRGRPLEACAVHSRRSYQRFLLPPNGFSAVRPFIQPDFVASLNNLKHYSANTPSILLRTSAGKRPTFYRPSLTAARLKDNLLSQHHLAIEVPNYWVTLISQSWFVIGCDKVQGVYGSGKAGKLGKVGKILVSGKVREFCEILSKVEEFFSKQYKNWLIERNMNCCWSDIGLGIPEFCQGKVVFFERSRRHPGNYISKQSRTFGETYVKFFHRIQPFN